jgi:sugar phosphate isomerase/epimerase
VLVRDGQHLTYCTNIHPAVGWEAVLESLRTHATALKARLSPAAPFGIGLRLSGAESAELLEGDRLARLREWLDAEGLYVFTLNAFPHGTFHGEPVKADVHAPDWRSDERVAYTLRMARILAALLPDGQPGTISTSPLSYRPWLSGPDDWQRCTANVVRVADGLRELREEDGVQIALALEPEADGALADCADLVRWWDDRLDREHLTACFDACHSAVAFEEPAAALAALADAGIRVGKVQLSAALRVPPGGPAGELARFADPVYLHQVARRSRDGAVTTWPDLPDALPELGDGEVRVHFHVPIFMEGYGGLESTQEHLRAVIELVPDVPHLEIETYTWDVLPAELKASAVESIAREYEWALGVLG